MPLTMSDPYRTYQIMGIDPGLNFTGLSVLTVDAQTKAILSVFATTLVNKRLPDQTRLDIEFIPERLIKLYKLKDAITLALHTYQPIVMVCESPFFNPTMPNAFGSLVETLNFIRQALVEFNPNIPFTTVAPLQVKATVGAGSQKGKLDMKACVMAREDIMSVLQNDIETLDEHAIDAIVVGYTLLRMKVS